ncbi:hypothetical protein CANCADRAFT_30064 [Tortispora caseinolytica NRRL Y-17796]|uniref:Uncharacterized protein n=1 Tax=Tortispora caseinolytica NRRL Y-17796 TaxID=767744 RepID=A0A1E4TJ06_9ASCO|nr:hypothetical protein CANCADRAFT_30064 [Tortispora caseinolytica NRRL Y-17796]
MERRTNEDSNSENGSLWSVNLSDSDEGDYSQPSSADDFELVTRSIMSITTEGMSESIDLVGLQMPEIDLESSRSTFAVLPQLTSASLRKIIAPVSPQIQRKLAILDQPNSRPVWNSLRYVIASEMLPNTLKIAIEPHSLSFADTPAVLDRTKAKILSVAEVSQTRLTFVESNPQLKIIIVGDKTKVSQSESDVPTLCIALYEDIDSLSAIPLFSDSVYTCIEIDNSQTAKPDLTVAARFPITFSLFMQLPNRILNRILKHMLTPVESTSSSSVLSNSTLSGTPDKPVEDSASTPVGSTEAKTNDTSGRINGNFLSIISSAIFICLMLLLYSAKMYQNFREISVMHAESTDMIYTSANTNLILSEGVSNSLVNTVTEKEVVETSMALVKTSTDLTKPSSRIVQHECDKAEVKLIEDRWASSAKKVSEMSPEMFDIFLEKLTNANVYGKAKRIIRETEHSFYKTSSAAKPPISVYVIDEDKLFVRVHGCQMPSACGMKASAVALTPESNAITMSVSVTLNAYQLILVRTRKFLDQNLHGYCVSVLMKSEIDSCTPLVLKSCDIEKVNDVKALTESAKKPEGATLNHITEGVSGLLSWPIPKLRIVATHIRDIVSALIIAIEESPGYLISKYNIKEIACEYYDAMTRYAGSYYSKATTTTNTATIAATTKPTTKPTNTPWNIRGAFDKASKFYEHQKPEIAGQWGKVQEYAGAQVVVGQKHAAALYEKWTLIAKSKAQQMKEISIERKEATKYWFAEVASAGAAGWRRWKPVIEQKSADMLGEAQVIGSAIVTKIKAAAIDGSKVVKSSSNAYGRAAAGYCDIAYKRYSRRLVDYGKKSAEQMKLAGAEIKEAAWREWRSLSKLDGYVRQRLREGQEQAKKLVMGKQRKKSEKCKACQGWWKYR